MTPLELCNKALALIGQKPINSLNPSESSASALCFLHYHPTRREVLASGVWDFACSIKELVKDESSKRVSVGHRNEFRLPQDTLRVIRTNDVGNWKLCGKRILSEKETIKISYIFDEENLDNFNNPAKQAFIYLLATKLAIPLTSNRQLREQNRKKFHEIINQHGK